MGFKVDSSFLKFVTMGAIGVRRVSELMTLAGLQPVELERYSRSNKIWATKVKRLRLPDLLCVRTGLRVEVRAKSKLSIKMSEAPGNPDRRWYTGLAARDMIAFILIRDPKNGPLRAAESAELFWVEDLTATESRSKLGRPKSQSEGAERDREWPSTVAKSNGVVQAITTDRITTRLAGGRNQSYLLRGKAAYLVPGEAFVAESQFLAGTPAIKAAFPNPEEANWNPRSLLESTSGVDRYIAVKALGVVGNNNDIMPISQIAEQDQDGRVALEAAAALVRLGHEQGLELLQRAITDPEVDYLRMEAVLALSEFPDTELAPRCAEILTALAHDEAFAGDEIRQAAIWGLGKAGLKNYDRLIEFLDVANEEELIHAVCAFGPDAEASLANKLLLILTDPVSSERKRASASLILARTIPTMISAPLLARLWPHQPSHARNWILATLGQMSPLEIQPHLNDAVLATTLQPLQLISPETNWTRSAQIVDKLAFVRKQSV